MPSATISRAITPQQAADALKQQLGSGYNISSHPSGSLTVKHGSLAFATVHLNRDGNTTTFRIHGGGLIIGRIVNEFGIARTVSEALKDSLGSAAPADVPTALTGDDVVGDEHGDRAR
jgi:hypothetical protein